MVIFHGISWATDEQMGQVKKGDKVAFVRMEDEWLEQLFEQFGKGLEIHLITDALRTKGWLIVTYIDYFKWKELKNQPILIQRCGFKDKSELKNNLIRLYGDILKDENPYLYYIEFEYKPFPK